MADESEKEKLLTSLLAHYGIEAKAFNPVHLANTLIYKIPAVSYTAKRSGLRQGGGGRGGQSLPNCM